MRPVNQLPLSLIEMKRSPLASSRNPDSPPKPRKLEVRINPLRYSSEPNRTRARSLVSKEGIGRALTSIETGAAIENSSGEGCFGGGCVASCARAICGTAADKSPAAVDFRKRRREKCAASGRRIWPTLDRNFTVTLKQRRRAPSPFGSRAVPGMIHYAAAHARQIQREPDTFWLSRHRKGPGMQYVNSIFGELLKPIDRRQFREIVERHDGNAYDKTFKSWEHLVTMVGAQLGGVASLRAVEATFKANSHQHYHLGARNVPRSTLSRANARRPVGVFADTFAMLAKKADRHTRAEGAEMVRLIDSSPIPLGKMCQWAEWNGRIRGLKMHVVYHPGKDVPRCVEITPATVNDVEVGRQTELEAGATYVFDKGYYHFGWWKKINAAKAFFVTRVKVNTRLRMTKSRYVRKTIGDGFRIIADADVVLASKGDSKLAIPLRRIKVKRDMGGTITLITNDLERTAVEIAALYKGRWQIELLFRWIKQHLDIRKFLGRNENAIRLQILAAMIAYVLLRIAARLHRLTMPALRLAELVCQRLFLRRPVAEIDKPPPCNPSKPQLKHSPNQLEFRYA